MAEAAPSFYAAQELIPSPGVGVNAASGPSARARAASLEEEAAR